MVLFVSCLYFLLYFGDQYIFGIINGYLRYVILGFDRFALERILLLLRFLAQLIQQGILLLFMLFFCELILHQSDDVVLVLGIETIIFEEGVDELGKIGVFGYFNLIFLGADVQANL